MKVSPLLFILPLILAPFQGQAETSLLKNSQPEHIMVNNRVLAKVNGKAISVMDLMKKMDILFYREFPQYASFPEARFQFYEVNWQQALQELIDKELIIADAEENKLPVTSGDIRQEMEQLFGPNIIENLDKIGITFDEAWKIIQGDILLHRMLYIRVNSKALREVTPKTVHAFYSKYAKENAQEDQWAYQVITVRNKNPEVGANDAQQIYQLLKTEGSKPKLTDLSEIIKKLPVAKESQITASEVHKHTEKELSSTYKEILQKLKFKTFSEPISQKSKDKSTVFRIFYLDEKIPGGVPPFDQVQAKLKETLISQEISAKTKEYLKRLRSHFDIHEMIPEGFKPFELK